MDSPRRVGFCKHVQVASGAKGLSFAGQVDGSNAGVVFDLADYVAKREAHLSCQRVARPFVGKSHDKNRSVTFGFKMRINSDHDSSAPIYCGRAAEPARLRLRPPS